MSAPGAGSNEQLAAQLERFHRGHLCAQRVVHLVVTGRAGRAAIAKARATLTDRDELDAFDRSVSRAALPA